MFGPKEVGGSENQRLKGLLMIAFLVIAIGGTATAFLPLFLGRHRPSARRPLCALQLEGIGRAMRGYAQDHGGKFPADLRDLVPAYLEEIKPFTNPCFPVDIGFQYLVGATLAEPGEIVLYENPPEKSPDQRRNALLASGEVMEFSKTEFEVALQKMIQNRLQKGLGLEVVPASIKSLAEPR